MNVVDYKSDKQWLPSMKTSEDAIVDTLLKLKRIADANRQGLEDYMHIQYSDYQYLLHQPFRRSFQKDEQDALDWQQTKQVPQ